MEERAVLSQAGRFFWSLARPGLSFPIGEAERPSPSGRLTQVLAWLPEMGLQCSTGWASGYLVRAEGKPAEVRGEGCGSEQVTGPLCAPGRSRWREMGSGGPSSPAWARKAAFLPW